MKRKSTLALWHWSQQLQRKVQQPAVMELSSGASVAVKTCTVELLYCGHLGGLVECPV